MHSSVVCVTFFWHCSLTQRAVMRHDAQKMKKTKKDEADEGRKVDLVALFSGLYLFFSFEK